MALKVGELFAEAKMETGGFTAGISTLTSSVAGFAKSATKKFALVGAAVAGLGAVLGVKAVKSAARFEQAMADVEASSGASADEMDRLEGKAKDLAKTSKFMIEDIAMAEKALLKSGYDIDETIDSLDGVVNATAAADADLRNTAVGLTNVVMGFQESAEETERFADVFAEADRTANVTIQSLVAGMKYLAPITHDMLKEINASKDDFEDTSWSIKELGMRVERVSAYMSVLGNNSIEAGQAGRQLRAAFLRFQKIQSGLTTQTQADLMENLAYQTFESVKAAQEWLGAVYEGKVTFLDFLTTLREGGATAGEFSKLVGQNASSAVTLLADQSDQVEKLTQRYLDSKGTAKEMAKIKLDTLSGQFDILQGSIDNMFQSLGEDLIPKLQTFLEDFVTPIVNKITDWIDKQGSLNDLFEALSNILGSETVQDLKEIGQGLGNFLKNVGDVLGPTLKKSLGFLKDLFQATAALLTGDWGRAGSELKQSIESLAETFGTLFNKIIDKTGLQGLVEQIENVINLIKGLINRIPFVNLGDVEDGNGKKVPGFAEKTSPWLKSLLESTWKLPSMALQQKLDQLSKQILNISEQKGQFLIPFSKMAGMERANLLSELIPALEGKISPKTATTTNVDITVGENVTVEERRNIEELNRVIQQAFDDWQRRQGNK